MTSFEFVFTGISGALLGIGAGIWVAVKIRKRK